jgi:DNA repair protein RadC
MGSLAGQHRIDLVSETAPAGRRVSSPGLLDLPAEERPRERLARLGAGALSTRELVTVLVGTGARGASALDLADELLGSGLRALAGRSLPDLERTRGLGRAKAGRLLAALELGARLASDGGGEAPVLASPEAAGRHLLPRYGARPVETFGLLALDVRRRLRREAVISVGCLTASLVHPREVFQEAVVSRAASLVLFHNHPSGDPEPSTEDLALTRRLAAAGTLMGIEVLDHLVLGAGRFVSLRERGVL